MSIKIREKCWVCNNRWGLHVVRQDPTFLPQWTKIGQLICGLCYKLIPKYIPNTQYRRYYNANRTK